MFFSLVPHSFDFPGSGSIIFFPLHFILDHLLFLFFPLSLLFLTLCREESFYCTVPITPVKREVEELDNIEEVSRLARLDMHGLPCQNTRGYRVLLLDQKFRMYIGHTLFCLYHSLTPARNWIGHTPGNLNDLHNN